MIREKLEALLPWESTIIELGEGLAKYVSNNDIANVVFLDCAARQAYIPLKYALRESFPGVKEPELFFFSPHQLKEQVYKSWWSSREIPTKINPGEKLRQALPKLYERRNLSTVIFDVCVHSGRTMNAAYKFLEGAGLVDIHPVVFSSPWYAPECAKLKKVICDNPRGCYPLQKSNSEVSQVVNPKYVREGDLDIVSEPSSPFQRERARANRRALHDFLSAYYSNKK